MCWSLLCSGDTRVRLHLIARSACEWLTVPRAHESMIDFRRAAGTFNVESRSGAAQESWSGSWTARTASFACRPGRARTCRAILQAPRTPEYTGPRIGGLGPNVRIYGAHHRFYPRVFDMVLRSIDPRLISASRILIILDRVPRYRHLWSL